MSKRKPKGLRRLNAVINLQSPAESRAGDFTAYLQEGRFVRRINLTLHKRTRQDTLAHDPHTGQSLYPYAPDEYEQLHIVGHCLQNGEHLPIKIFIRDNLGFGDERLKMHTKIWRQWVLMAGLGGLAVGLGLAIIVIST